MSDTVCVCVCVFACVLHVSVHFAQGEVKMCLWPQKVRKKKEQVVLFYSTWVCLHRVEGGVERHTLSERESERVSVRKRGFVCVCVSVLGANSP